MHSAIGTTAVIMVCIDAVIGGAVGYVIHDDAPQYYATHWPWWLTAALTVAIPLYLSARQTNMHPKNRRGQHH